MTVEQVIALSQSRTADSQIIQKIDKSGTVFRLTAADLTALRAGKVSDPVVTHMLDTYTRELLNATAEEEQTDYSYGYQYPFTIVHDDVSRQW